MAKFPLCAATHDQGLRWLFDFAAIALLLDCRPGDRVLDLGAGSGFSSEMLARFGYDVVAIDPDRAALVTNRRRPCFDARRIDGRVAVAGAAAEALPFPARSFDGIFCMNVLHHCRICRGSLPSWRGCCDSAPSKRFIGGVGRPAAIPQTHHCS